MRRPRGFSLIELMLTLFIVAIAVAMGFSVARGTRGHMSVPQVAHELLAELRWARQQAMTRGVPAGLLLPVATAAGRHGAPRRRWICVTRGGRPSHPNMQDGPPAIPALGSLPPDLPVGPLQYPKPYALPTIVKLDVLPTANVDALPPGAVAGSTYSVVENGRLCLTVTAPDPNGDRLYCNCIRRRYRRFPARCRRLPRTPRPSAGETIRSAASSPWRR